ncbi:GlsB/YeaQ/YmgE family stress response membrane protein [Nostoc sp.]|uniref:GlsB/YeaQ/YmgE family stress response membrane protein n=1 Tax=Nostoc sp. TaxID=1180 RepID=UPI002FFD2A92
MSIIAWIVLGLLAGATAKAIYPGYQGSAILSTMIFSIIGAFVGGSLFTLLRTGTPQITSAGAGLIPGILVAVLCAIVAIYIWGLIQKKQECIIADWQLSALT